MLSLYLFLRALLPAVPGRWHDLKRRPPIRDVRERVLTRITRWLRQRRARWQAAAIMRATRKRYAFTRGAYAQNLTALTQETIAQMQEPMRKATTTGYTTATGLVGFELAAPSKFLVAVLTPLRNRITRKMAPVGSKNATWRAITAINAGNASPFVGFGAPGVVMQTTEQDYFAPYQPLAHGDSVQMDAQMLARGFEDLRASAGTRLLYATMISEDKIMLGGQAFALQTPGTPTVTTATTGGSIAQTTAVHFVVAVRTIEGYYYNLSNAAGTAAGTAAGGGTVTSADGTATTPTDGLSTHTAQATVAFVPGAVAYDWYCAANTTAYWFVGTTTTNVSPVITALPSADATNPTVGPPRLTIARAGGGNNIRTGGAAFVDTSADANAFNGLLPSMVADVNSSGAQVTHGTATSSGAYFASLDGATLTGSNGTISQIDTALLSIWNNFQISPTRMYMNAQQHYDVSNKMFATGTVNTFLQGEDITFRQDGVAGVFMTKYINKAANGYPIMMETEPNLPPGVILMLSEVIPFPQSEVNAVFELETQMEYTQLEYAMNRGAAGSASGGPRYDVEVRAIETFKNYYPAGCAAIHNIAAG